MGALDSFPRRKLSVDDFRRMGEAGILREDDRVELIDGEMIETAPIGVAHASKVNRLSRLFLRAVADQANVSIQNPIVLAPRDEPQPDIALLKPRLDDYAGALPSAGDVVLIVEVADTTLRYDRDVKIPLYARHGIPEVWLVDLQSESVVVYRQPGPDGYADVMSIGAEEALAPVALPQASIDLAELWRR
jgi:Uma2 family endonuclease